MTLVSAVFAVLALAAPAWAVTDTPTETVTATETWTSTITATSTPTIPWGDLSNSYLQVPIDSPSNTYPSRYTMRTASSYSPANSTLLYAGFSPWSSYTTIRIGGVNYRLGDPPQILLGAQYTSATFQESTWMVGPNVDVMQRLELVNNPYPASTPRADTMKITLQITNNSGSPQFIGARVMYDTMIAGNDGEPIRVTGLGFQGNQVNFEPVPTAAVYFQAYDFTSGLEGQGTIRPVGGATATTPDRLTVANWGNVFSNPWYVTAGGSVGSDTAVALYWSELAMGPGDIRTLVTYYGINQIPLPKLSVIKSAAPSAVWPGQSVTFNIAYGNPGTGPAAGSVITDVLPANMSFISAAPSVTPVGQTLSWNLGTLGPGAGGTILINALVTSPGTIVNRASGCWSDPAFNETFCITSTPAVVAVLTPTATITLTRTASPSHTVSLSPTESATRTESPTPTESGSPTVTRTESLTRTETLTRTESLTPTVSGTPTESGSPTATRTSSPTGTISRTMTETSTRSETRTPCFTRTISMTFTISLTPTISWTPSETWTATISPTWTESRTETRTRTESPTRTISGTSTSSRTSTATATVSPTRTESGTSTVSGTPTASRTESPTATASGTSTASRTSTSTRTETPTLTVSGTRTETWTESGTPTVSGTPTETGTITETFTDSPTVTASPSRTRTASRTSTSSATPTGTASASNTGTASTTSTASATETVTVSATETATQTTSATSTVTETTSATATFTASATPSPLVPGTKAIAVYPNPATGSTVTLVLWADDPVSVSVESWNAALQPMSKSSGAGGPGFVSIVLDVSSWGPGVYILRAESKSTVTGRTFRHPPTKLALTR